MIFMVIIIVLSAKVRTGSQLHHKGSSSRLEVVNNDTTVNTRVMAREYQIEPASHFCAFKQLPLEHVLPQLTHTRDSAV